MTHHLSQNQDFQFRDESSASQPKASIFGQAGGNPTFQPERSAQHTQAEPKKGPVSTWALLPKSERQPSEAQAERGGRTGAMRRRGRSVRALGIGRGEAEPGK